MCNMIKYKDSMCFKNKKNTSKLKQNKKCFYNYGLSRIFN